jgi:hypothetical protein
LAEVRDARFAQKACNFFVGCQCVGLAASKEQRLASILAKYINVASKKQGCAILFGKKHL